MIGVLALIETGLPAGQFQAVMADLLLFEAAYWLDRVSRPGDGGSG